MRLPASAGTKAERRLSHDMVAAYEENLVCLIRHSPCMEGSDPPVVIAVAGLADATKRSTAVRHHRRPTRCRRPQGIQGHGRQRGDP